MPKLLSVALLLLLALPASAAAEETAPVPAIPDGGCTFGWTPGASVRITEKVDKGEGVALEQYTVTLAARDDGNFEVRYSDFVFLEFRGEKMTPELEKELAPVIALASAIPTVVVSPQGSVVGIEGFDAMIEGIEKVMVEKGATAEEAAMAAGMLRAPGVDTLLTSTVRGIWDIWVGDWVGFDLAPGASADGEVPVDAANPEGAKQKLHVENRGAADGHPGALSFASTLTLDGEAGAAMMRPMFDGMMGGMAPDERQKMEAVLAGLSASIVREGTVVTDPATLRPVAATMTKTTVMQLAAMGMDQTKTETHEYTFDWK